MLIAFDDIISKYNLAPKGVIHLGAHLGEESEFYQKHNISEVLWVEGNPDLARKLRESVGTIKGNYIAEIIVSDKDGEKVTFNIGADDQTSSILEVGEVKEYHGEDVDVVKAIKHTTTRLDTYLKKYGLNESSYDFLNIDLQGAELLALKGLGDVLDNIDVVVTEVNLTDSYKGCPKLYELDLFLSKKGFIRTELVLTPWRWGDALYLRKPFNKFELALTVIEAITQQWLSFFKTRSQKFMSKVKFKLKLSNR